MAAIELCDAGQPKIIPGRGLRLRAGDTVLIFGASVTSQVHNLFDVALGRTGLDLKIIKAGYGATHLPLARVLIDELLATHRPDVCILDWTSTDYKEAGEDTLRVIDYVLWRLAERSCAALLYYHPRTDFDEARVRMIRDCFDRVAAHYGVPSIHAYALVDDPASYLRDHVHVTPDGATRLGSLLHGWIESIRTQGSKSLPTATRSLYPPIQVLRTHTDSWITFFAQQPLQLQPPQAGAALEFFEMKIGPYSPVIAVETDAERKTIQLWDRWCHFERTQHVPVQLQSPGAATIRILAEAPIDYSQCKEDRSRWWHETAPKRVCLRTVYWLAGG